MCSELADSRFKWIYIGNKNDAKNLLNLSRNKIRYILNVTPSRVDGGIPNYHEKNSVFTYCRIPLTDNNVENLSSHYAAAWDFFERVRIREDGNLLVHCNLGVSRSISVVCSYLIKFCGMTLEDSLNLIKKTRSIAKPNDSFLFQLKLLEGEVFASRVIPNGMNRTLTYNNNLKLRYSETTLLPSRRPKIGPVLPPNSSECINNSNIPKNNFQQSSNLTYNLEYAHENYNEEGNNLDDKSSIEKPFSDVFNIPIKRNTIGPALPPLGFSDLSTSDMQSDLTASHKKEDGTNIHITSSRYYNKNDVSSEPVSESNSAEINHHVVFNGDCSKIPISMGDNENNYNGGLLPKNVGISTIKANDASDVTYGGKSKTEFDTSKLKSQEQNSEMLRILASSIKVSHENEKICDDSPVKDDSVNPNKKMKFTSNAELQIYISDTLYDFSSPCNGMGSVKSGILMDFHQKESNDYCSKLTRQTGH